MIKLRQLNLLVLIVEMLKKIQFLYLTSAIIRQRLSIKLIIYLHSFLYHAKNTKMKIGKKK